MSKAKRRLLGTGQVFSQGEEIRRAGIREQNLLYLQGPQCPSPFFPPSMHRVAVSAWPLTCAHCSHENPAPQDGKWGHSRASPAGQWDGGPWDRDGLGRRADPGL